MKRRSGKAIASFFLLSQLIAGSGEAAPANDLAVLRQQIAEQQRLIRAQQEQLARQQKVLESQGARYERLFKRVEELGGEPASAPRYASPSSSALASATPQEEEAPEVGTDRKPLDHGKMPEITVLDATTGVLLPPGKFVLEPGIEYTNSSSIRTAIEGFTIVPAITIGALQISEVSRDTLTARLTGRAGLTNRLEADVSIPYTYRHDRTRARPFGIGASTDVLTSVSGNDIGDVEAGLHYQINKGNDGWPVFIANGRFKSTTGTGPFEVPIDPDTGLQLELPTGSGFYSVQPSVTAIFPSDPVVFFGNLGYGVSFKRDTNRGEIDPGDSVSASAGMSLLLNDRLSLSLSYGHDVVFRTEQNGRTLPGSTLLQVGALSIGTSYKLYDNMSLNFITSIGVTEHAPDIRLLVKTPFTFDF
jgi:hypothetical protein